MLSLCPQFLEDERKAWREEKQKVQQQLDANVKWQDELQGRLSTEVAVRERVEMQLAQAQAELVEVNQ